MLKEEITEFLQSFSLPPLFAIRMLQTTNVILQIKGAAGAAEETINCFVQGVYLLPHHQIPHFPHI